MLCWSFILKLQSERQDLFNVCHLTHAHHALALSLSSLHHPRWGLRPLCHNYMLTFHKLLDMSSWILHVVYLGILLVRINDMPQILIIFNYDKMHVYHKQTRSWNKSLQCWPIELKELHVYTYIWQWFFGIPTNDPPILHKIAFLCRIGRETSRIPWNQTSRLREARLIFIVMSCNDFKYCWEKLCGSCSNLKSINWTVATYCFTVQTR